MKYRFHVLGLAHTISTPEQSTCAFTQKVVKLCRMLKARGHHVTHYGHEDSSVDCTEHVTVVTRDDWAKAYGDHDWRRLGHVNSFRTDDQAYRAFDYNACVEIAKRKRPGDFLLCAFGTAHQKVGEFHRDMLVVEPGIGYPTGTFAKYRVFESYALMHAYLGLPLVSRADMNAHWYDAVIPNYFDLADFDYGADKGDYFLFLGRVGDGKGTHIAQQIVEAVGGTLIVAGAGEMKPSKHVEPVGVVGPQRRRELLTRAKAVIAPSMFLEPFCGVQIEAMLSGTPVISTDWGAFAEYNVHGVTGWRCRTFEQFTWAARNVGKIDPAACRSYAEANFSLERVGAMYEEYWAMVRDESSKGWYARNPERADLDWLRRAMPVAV